MAKTIKTKRENLKKQMDTIIETAQYTDTRSWRGDTREVYTMHHSGTFTAEYEIRPTGWTRAEMEEELRRRARRIDNRRDINTQKLDLRSNRLQRAMAYIGDHREMIPFLTHVSDSIRQGMSMDDAVADYCTKHGRPTFVHRDYNHRTRDYFYNFAPRGYYESELVAQVPYLPKAWRCA